MNREIKFRAWVPLQNKFLSYSLDVNGMLGHGGSVWESEQLSSEDVILMQYTGLKDRNGKEIYEGDAVRLETQEIAVACFHAGCFFFDLDRSHTGAFNIASLINNIAGHCEVIGNIYEHPELVKDG